MNQPVFSVSQVNAYIRQMFSTNGRLRYLSVSGEVSSCNYHSSGHLYFTIKDKLGQLSCVMFASACRHLDFTLEKGQSVIVTGSISVYERDGKYQLYAEQIEKEGQGQLFARIEQLKRRLEAEGLFSPERKKPIPRFATTVGIVTAATGAAIHDIMQISARRNLYVQLLLQPALVQGEAAPESLVRAIRLLDMRKPDVIILGRGGGSAEDLMAFNAEAVVRAVAECETPIISAVGHEVDVALTDFAADLRAPTPSAAAELAVFEYQAFAEELAGFHSELAYGMLQKLQRLRMRADGLNERLLRVGPAGSIREKKDRLLGLRKELRQGMRQKLLKRKHTLELLAGKLHAGSPAARLSGGYAYVSIDGKAPLVSVSQVTPGERLKISVKDGDLWARAEEAAQHGKEQ